jgi:hypothetical protein
MHKKLNNIEDKFREIIFADQKLILDLSIPAIFIPDYKCLIVSDLHLEKGSFLRKYGNPIPAYDTIETLKLLSTLLDKYQPQKLIALGDSFHDIKSFERIDQRSVDQINNITNNYDFTWILGNHDPEIPDFIKGKKTLNYKIGDISLNHEYEPDHKYQIVGHYHPKNRVKLPHKKISCKAFVKSYHLLVMPSLGYYTGGLFADSDVINKLFPGQKIIYNIY